jgi:glycosyltransferase involved in cell wall biosynthesis
MRRVALIIGQLGAGGGAERQLAHLALGLPRSRWQPEVFCLSSLSEPLGATLRSAGVPVHVLPSRGRRDLARLAKLASALRGGDYALGHSWLSADNVYHALASLLAPARPVVTSFRSSEGPRRGAWSWLEAWAYGLSHSVVTNSEAGKRFLLLYRNVSPTKVRVLPNGVDFSRLDGLPDRESSRAALGIPSGATVALFLGWFRVEKNFPLLLGAAARLREDHPGLHWLLVGEGEERASVERLTERHGLASCVHLAGERQDLREVMAASDLFVLTSDWEGLPGALLESQGAGLPAVTTDVGDCRRVIEGAGSGRLVPVGDEAALAKAVSFYVRDRAAREREGRAGREYVRTTYGIPAMVRNMESLYEELCCDGPIEGRGARDE